MAEAGWQMDREHADGADALSAALRRRGWNAVLYGGDGPGAVPARKALALVRLADPHLRSSPSRRTSARGDLSSVIRGLDDAAIVISDPARAGRRADQGARRRPPAPPRRQRPPPAARPAGDRRPPGRRAWTPRRCASACWPRSARRSAGASARSGARRDEQSLLRPTAVWHAAGARPSSCAFAEQTREAALRPRPGHARPRVGVPAARRGSPTSRATRACRALDAARCAPG